MLEDVAEAMSQLDDYRDELDELDAMRRAVQQFGTRYQRYAQIAARRRAADLRAAQTRYDNASRELNQHAAAARAAQAERLAAEQAGDHEQTTLRELRARLDVLRADPVMRDAARLVHADAEVAQQQGLHAEADLRRAGAERQLANETSTSTRRRDEAAQGATELREHLGTAARAADETGLADAHARALGELTSPDAASTVAADFPRALLAAAQAALARRREQIGVLRRRLRELRHAEQRRDLARAQREANAEQHAGAEQAQEAALRQRARDGEALLAGARHWLARLQVLGPLDAFVLAAELESWIETLSGPNPLREAADAARRDVERELAALAAGAAQQRRVLDDERATLTAERQRLGSGEDAPPPAPHWRAADAPRRGAALWRLIDFAPELPVSERASIEAALEAAGLLDAIVTADGNLFDAGTSDMRLAAGGQQQRSLLGVLRVTLPEGADLGAASVGAALAGIAYGSNDVAGASAWIAPDGRFRVGPLEGRHHKAEAAYIGHAARAAARRLRLAQIEERLARIDAHSSALDEAEAARSSRAQTLADEHQSLPGDDALRHAEAQSGAAERQRREAQARLGAAETQLAQAEQQLQRAASELRFDAEDLRLPEQGDALDALERALHDYRQAVGELAHAIERQRRTLAELVLQQQREEQARAEQQSAAAAAQGRERALAAARSVLATLRETVGEAVEALRERIASTEAAELAHQRAAQAAQKALIEAGARAAASEQRREDAEATLEERGAARSSSIEHLHAFASTGLLAVAAPGVELPPLDLPWGVEAALTVARRSEQALAAIDAGDDAWTLIQRGIGADLTQLQQAMSAQGHAAVAEPGEYGLVVRIVVRQRSERPDLLAQQLGAELAERRAILSAQEREVLENHLQQDIAVNLQRLIQDTERRVISINRELHHRPTSTGMRYRLDWHPLPEDNPDAPAGLAEARRRLLKTHADAWSADDRRAVGEFLHARIQAERSRASELGREVTASMFESLARALDYRRWHRFRVQRKQDGRDDSVWRPLAGPASSGERALGLTVPLFAAASSHYESAAAHAPRLVLLDEAFAGIDDEARASCMGLIREFDLDFVMTSEREWGCYAELPGLAICQIVRREGVDAAFVSRWSWDGRARRREEDPDRRFPSAVLASEA